jgi:hypothetical protein
MTSLSRIFAALVVVQTRQFGRLSNSQGCEEVQSVGESARGWAKLERARGLQ